MKCTKCGNEYEGNFCPNCGYSGKPKKKGCGVVILSLVIGMFVFAAIMGILFGEETPSDTESSSILTSTSNTQEENTKNIYETEKDLITFEGVKAEFVKVYDPKAGVTALAVALNLQNNGTEEVTVTLADGYVNDTKVQFMTGLPVTIAPGKKAVGVFMFGYDGLGFSKVEDIENMEFKISLLNSNWSDLKTSKKVELKFK